jgi:CRISPR-associated endonuclease/helicase Cas3
MVCDLSTFDSMAQRFGRVNRFGVRKDSEIHIVHPPAESFDAAKPMDKARGITLSLLQDLDGDACPEALGRLDMASRESGFAPKPKVLPTSGVLFDAWAMTTIRGHLPGRPPVSTYLHGVEEWEPSRSFVAWRDEVDEIHNRDRRRLLDKYPAQELLEDYPLKPHELLSDTTSRVLDRLRGLIELIEKSAKQEGRIVPEIPAWFVDEEGEVQTWSSLKDWLPDDRKTAEQFLAGRTILLSPAHCHPVGGRLSPEGIGAGLERADVADLWLDQNGTPSLRLRKFTTERGERAPPGMRRIRSIVLADDDVSGANEDADAEPSWRIWNWYELPHLADSEGSESGKASVKLDVHLADVAEAAQTIVNGLDLDERMRVIVVTAAGLHDLGKRRRLWQRGVGNHDPSLVLAKSGKRSSGSSSYRHELGSTLDAERERLIEGFSQDERDLLLHLVAAHHGRARPHFPSKELFDPEVPEVEMSELGQQVVTRFAALQKRFGRWGLAYLESLVRAADYAASANPSSEI